jgi:hypothetical protein
MRVRRVELALLFAWWQHENRQMLKVIQRQSRIDLYDIAGHWPPLLQRWNVDDHVAIRLFSSEEMWRVELHGAELDCLLCVGSFHVITFFDVVESDDVAHGCCKIGQLAATVGFGQLTQTDVAQTTHNIEVALFGHSTATEREKRQTAEREHSAAGALPFGVHRGGWHRFDRRV